MTDVSIPPVDAVQQTAEAIVANLSVVQRFASQASSYYTATVNLETTITWLLQFPTPRLATSAIHLLSRFHFVDSNRLTALLETALSKIPPEDAARARFCAAGRDFESAALIAYEFSKHLGLSERALAERWTDLPGLAAATNPSLPLVLLDDNLASGFQLRRFISELHADHEGPREHFPKALTSDALHALHSIPIYAAVAVELGSGRQEVERFAAERGLNLKIVSGHVDLTRWLEYGGPIWTSREEADEFRDFASTTARALFADKHWDTSLLEDRLLGYGNSQRLSAFFHNIPKTLVSIFWKFGKVNEHNWLPLLPERSEWQKYRAEIATARPELRYIARLIASGGIGKTAASCSVNFVFGGDSDRGIVMEVPDGPSIQKLKESLLGTSRSLEPMSEPSDMARTVNPLVPHGMVVATYNEKVERYNRDLITFQSGVMTACEVAMRLVAAPLRVYNDGTATAFEVVLTLELPADVDFVSVFPELPKRPEEPTPPRSSFDYAHDLHLMAMKLAKPPASTSRFSSTRDRGRKLLKVFVGKIVPTTFRDVNVEFLRVPAGQELTIPYQLVHEDSSRPTEGTLHITTRPASGIPERVKAAWEL